MKKIKKIFLLISAIVIISIMSIVSISAAHIEYSFGDDNIMLHQIPSCDCSMCIGGDDYNRTLIVVPDFKDGEDVDLYETPVLATTYPVHHNGSQYFAFHFTENFKEYIIDTIMSNKDLINSKYSSQIGEFEYTTDYFLKAIKRVDFTEFGYKIAFVTDTSSNIRNYMRLENLLTYNEFEYTEAGYNSFLEQNTLSYFMDNEVALSNGANFFVSEYGLYLNNLRMNEMIEENEAAVNLLEGQMADLNSEISEKEELIGEITMQNQTLQWNNDALEQQVDNLVSEKSILNAEKASLEKQMQLKINKVYAEGLADANGDGSGSTGLLSAVIVILTIAEVVALIYFFVSKARNRKRR